jgi:hypothetical protein
MARRADDGPRGEPVNPLRWRFMTWLVWGWTGLMAAVAVALVAATVASNDCEGVDRATCDAATGIAGTAWIGASFCLWFLGFAVLAIVWFMTKPDRRYCPRCGQEARRGQTVCRRCGLDFGAIPTRS